MFISLKDMLDFGKQIGFSNEQRRACNMHTFYQALYHPACLVLIEALLKGQNRSANFRDVPAYLKRLLRHVILER